MAGQSTDWVYRQQTSQIRPSRKRRQVTCHVRSRQLTENALTVDLVPARLEILWS